MNWYVRDLIFIRACVGCGCCTAALQSGDQVPHSEGGGVPHLLAGEATLPDPQPGRTVPLSRSCPRAQRLTLAASLASQIQSAVCAFFTATRAQMRLLLFPTTYPLFEPPAVVFFSGGRRRGSQGMMISFMVMSGAISTSEDAKALQNLLTCVEMVPAAVMMLFAFPHTDYRTPVGLTRVANAGLRSKLGHAISIHDVVSDTVHQVRARGGRGREVRHTRLLAKVRCGEPVPEAARVRAAVAGCVMLICLCVVIVRVQRALGVQRCVAPPPGRSNTHVRSTGNPGMVWPNRNYTSGYPADWLGH